ECREMGIPLLPPDIQSGEWHFTPAGNAIRFGLGAVKNVGRNAVEAIVAARQEAGPFDSLFHFCERVDPRALNKRVLESLIKAGAMDSLGERGRLYAAIDRALEAGQKVQRAREAGQQDLFGGAAVSAAESARLPDAPPWEEARVLAGEKEMLGFYLTGHPMRQYQEKLRDLGTVRSCELSLYSAQKEVALGGILGSVRVARNKRGELWASAVLEDLDGSVDLLFFPEAYKRLGSELKQDAVVFVKGKVLVEENAPPKVSVSELLPLNAVEPALASAVVIRIRLGSGDGSVARKLRELFEEKRGEAPVRLEFERAGAFQAELEPEIRVRPDPDFAHRARALCGKDAVLLI
ncbi:MAG TPA: OB-fold nucleic acid binding domain-containing protein, partial [Terriglobia bacterium]|nr:OB-fold nucleic acid binding domain-containing protein [Terriglobia bacterium]